MGRGERIGSEVLAEAGLEAMRRHGKPLARLQSKGRSMIYALPNGETVRMRTCNDHALIVVADKPDLDAKLNVEGTDWLLLVMPEVERKMGKVDVYLLPSAEVVKEARRTHKEWLTGNPNTKGDNKAWALWFDKDAPEKANDYGSKWAKYKIKEDVSTAGGVMYSKFETTEGTQSSEGQSNIRDTVEKARREIAAIAGVAPEAVKITINFEG